MKIKKILKNKILDYLQVNKLERFVGNINYDFTIRQKRVLISYIDFFRAGRDITVETVHTNRLELFQIIKSFIDLNYIVDICSCDNEEAYPIIDVTEYDLVFGMGKVFRRFANMNTKTKTILYLTENPYFASYIRESERVKYFQLRNNLKADLYRTGRVFLKDEELKSDYVFYMGDTIYADSFKEKMYKISPTGLYNKNFKLNYVSKEKQSFLVLGTAGMIHKGIDLLVEVFQKNTNWKLYLCGQNNTRELKKLGYELKYDNIIDCGHVDIDSDIFIELVNKCRYILLPSCSEAQPTGVLTGMRHGLIPVITKGLGMDQLEEFCYYFDGYHTDDIEKLLCYLEKINEIELNNRSLKVYEYSNYNYSLEHFTKMFKENLNALLEE